MAQKYRIDEPYLVGGVPRDRLIWDFNKRKNGNSLLKLGDIDIGNGQASIKNLAKEVEIALSKQFSISSKTMDDGHISLFLKSSDPNKEDGFKIDFSSNYIYPQIDQELQKLSVKKIDNIIREAYSRDFFCNTLMLSLDFKRIKDPTGQGISDIKNKILRTCLDPNITLRANTNRIPRVLYLSAKLDFTVDPNIINWIKTHKELIVTIDSSYLTKTLNKAVQYNKATVVKLLDEMGLWNVLPMTEALYPDYAQRFLKTAQFRTNYDYNGEGYFGEMKKRKSVVDFLKERKKKQMKKLKKKAYFEGVEDGFDTRVWLSNDWIINDEDPIRMDRYENQEPDGTPIKPKEKKKEKKLDDEDVPEQETAMQPNPFYEEIYGGAHGFNGLYSSPLEYFSGSIVDDGTTANPWQKLYQMASNYQPQDLLKLSSFFLSHINKLA